MAEFLIAHRSVPGGFDAGDIVVARADGHQWSAGESPRVSKVPGLPLEVAERYTIGDFETYEVAVSALANKERDPTKHRTEDKALWIARADDAEDMKRRSRPNVPGVPTETLDKCHALRRYKLVGGRIIDKTGLKPDPGDPSKL